MDIFVLDSAMNRVELVEEFKSFIWTHRYSDFGDFQLDILPTIKNRRRVKEGILMGTNFTDKPMRVDTVHITEDESGVPNMKVTGRALESFIEHGILIPNYLSSDPEAKVYYRTGQVGAVLKGIIDDVYVLGNGINVADIIPGFASTNSAGTMPTIEIGLSTGTVYKAVKDLCDEHLLGFRLEYRRTNTTTPWLFRIYKGVDRPNVEFSATLDNIAQESYLNSSKEFKNVAYVESSGDRAVEVFGNGGGPSVTGFNRRVLLVQATDVDPTKITEPKLTNILTQRGRTALKNHRRVRLMDGVITDYSKFKFGVDYNLGDTIYIRDEYGNRTAKRIEEYIWVYDGEGPRQYPTFASND